MAKYRFIANRKFTIMSRKRFITEHNVKDINDKHLEKLLDEVMDDPDIEVTRAWYSEEDRKVWLEGKAEDIYTLRHSLEGHSMPYDRLHIINKRWNR